MNSMTLNNPGDALNPPVDAPFDSLAPEEFDEIGLRSSVLLETGMRNFSVVEVAAGGRRVLATTGEYGKAASVKLATKDGVVGEHHVSSAIVCFDSDGDALFRKDFTLARDNSSISVYPTFIDTTGNGVWAISYIAGPRGEHDLWLTTLDGNPIWSVPAPGKNKWGNGSCVHGDIDGDGRVEIVYGCNSAVVCVDALTGRVRWVYDDDVAICHGRLALGDVNGDGEPEICFGTEYSDDQDKHLSSMVVLNRFGEELARKRRIVGDLGSTQTVLADIDGDGCLEILNTSQNLCWNEPRHPAAVFAFDGSLKECLPPIANGAPRFTVADIDGDGRLEAVGLTDYRDGGPLARFAVVCVDLAEGGVKWTMPIPRCWLAGDPVCADIDGDGAPEILLTTNYPSGYAFQPGTRPWSDMLVVKADGSPVFRKTFPDMIYSPIVTDLRGDGSTVIVAPCYDGRIYSIETPAKACETNWPLNSGDMRRTGVYPNFKTGDS